MIESKYFSKVLSYFAGKSINICPKEKNQRHNIIEFSNVRHYIFYLQCKDTSQHISQNHKMAWIGWDLKDH